MRMAGGNEERTVGFVGDWKDGHFKSIDPDMVQRLLVSLSVRAAYDDPARRYRCESAWC
jgi:hypothetical protein|tara:strand:- start:986 stop:1162 length:177 start_codon:yes stop_codon:yes gene_type:complete